MRLATINLKSKDVLTISLSHPGIQSLLQYLMSESVWHYVAFASLRQSNSRVTHRQAHGTHQSPIRKRAKIKYMSLSTSTYTATKASKSRWGQACHRPKCIFNTPTSLKMDANMTIHISFPYHMFSLVYQVHFQTERKLAQHPSSPLSPNRIETTSKMKSPSYSILLHAQGV